MKEKTKPLPATAEDKLREATACAMVQAGLDAAEFQRVKSTYNYPIVLMQRFILDFVRQLKTEKHHIYAMLLHGSHCIRNSCARPVRHPFAGASRCN